MRARTIMPSRPAEITLFPTFAIQPAVANLDCAAALVLDAVGSDYTRRAPGCGRCSLRYDGPWPGMRSTKL